MNYFRRQKYSDQGFPIITEPIEAMGWWFWGAMGVSCVMWGILIAAVCRVTG